MNESTIVDDAPMSSVDVQQATGIPRATMEQWTSSGWRGEVLNSEGGGPFAQPADVVRYLAHLLGVPVTIGASPQGESTTTESIIVAEDPEPGQELINRGDVTSGY